MPDGDCPLLEFDSARVACIEPYDEPKAASLRAHGIIAPEVAVACFFADLLPEVCAEGRVLCPLPSQLPFWELDREGRRIGVLYPGIGAPLATLALEQVVALGTRTVICCGGSGVLVPSLAVGHVIVPTGAVRDEGTSFHYLPAGREVLADPGLSRWLTDFLEARGVPHVAGKVWTTDAPYRETRGKVVDRRDEGCIAVDMEASALFALSQFRVIKLGMLLYAGDDLSGDEWDHRDWNRAHDVRRSLLDLALSAAVELDETET